MDNKNSRKKELDDFWDISELIPRNNYRFGAPKGISSVEVTANAPQKNTDNTTDSTVIKRYISSKDGTALTKRSELEETDSYSPQNSLIHNVKIFKYKTAYPYYEAFLRKAEEYIGVCGEPTEFVPFFSYVPQYDQMNEMQLKYYFWFRENAKKGEFIKTDFGYLFLYIFELLNLGDKVDTKSSQYILMSLWNAYSSEFPVITTKLADWICDFSMLHRLSPPVNISSDIIRKTVSLKEFYISIPRDDLQRSAEILLRYCSSYDYRASKFYTDANKALFDRHIIGALTIAIRYYSKDGNILSGLDTGDSTVTRDVFAGALCTAAQKYRIEVSYCSFSRSNELRFLVGDIIKYSENKLRAYIGIKSKMTVYSLSVELREMLDNYFSTSLPAARKAKQAPKRQEYDVLYDLPIKPLSLSDAARIEANSWETTKDLISAFEEDASVQEESFCFNIPSTVTNNEPDNKKEAEDVFSQYRAAITNLIDGNGFAIFELAAALGKMPDAVVDAINEIAYDSFGDLLIEDDGMGGYTVIEDYIEYFKK